MRKSHKISEETKEKLRIANLGKKMSKESKEKIRIGQLGNKNKSGWVCPDETKLKISQATKGRIGSFLGLNHSEESKEKIKLNHKGGWPIGKKHTQESKTKLSLAKVGKYSTLWHEGYKVFSKRIRKSFKYEQWRNSVFKRDNYTCQNCNVRGSKELHPHHIIPFSKIIKDNNIKTYEESLECSQLWNINNGKTLCRECHKLTPTFGFKVYNENLLS